MGISEQDLQNRIIDYARLRGWKIVHIRNIPVADRCGRNHYTVPYEGDKGLPDLILARHGAVLLAELKSEKGKPTPEQIGWLHAAGDHGYLWRPSDWPEIMEVLR